MEIVALEYRSGEIAIVCFVPAPCNPELLRALERALELCGFRRE